MKNDLIDRYIYAVTKRMSPKIREDVEKELYSLVEDMLAERCGDMVPTEKDIRVVLTELGSPRELYEKYDSDSKKCLIGQPYYSMYIFVLRIVLLAGGLGMTLALALEQIMEPQNWYAAIGNWLSAVWTTLLAAFAFVTILFAVFYHKGIKLDVSQSLDNLPPVPRKNRKISVWGPVVSIVATVLMLVLILTVPQVFCLIQTKEGIITPIFDAAVIRGSWYILVLWAACAVIQEVVRLMERRYSPAVMLATIGTNAVSALLAIWWTSLNGLIAPAMQEKVAEIFTGDASFLGEAMMHFHRFILVIILFALAIDTIDTVVKSLKK